MKDVRPLDVDETGARTFSVATYGRPDALIFKQAHISEVTGAVCSQCGYLELYALNPQALVIPR